MMKGKKGKKEAELEETSNVETMKGSDEETQEIVGKKVSKRAEKKERKKSARTDEFDDDDQTNGANAEEEVTKNMEKLNLGKKGKKKGKKAKNNDSDDNEPEMVISQPAFALLGVDSDGSDDDNGGMKSDEEIQKKPKQKKKTTVKKQEEEEEKKETGGKKGKKARKAKNEEDDDDIDAMLAELEMEYTGVKKPETKPETPKEPTETPSVKTAAEKKRDKKKKKQQTTEEVAADDEKETEKEKEKETPPPVETAPVETKEKKKKKKGKAQETTEEPPATVAAESEKPAESEAAKPAEEEAKDSKKKKGPGKAMVAAMQERLKKIKEEEEKMKREEDERIRRLEEAEQARLEKARLEQEKKDKKKQKEKERKEKLKAEGKLLTAKQKADKARAQAMIDALKAQGVDVPEVGGKTMRPGTRIRPNKNKKEQQQDPKSTETDEKAGAQETADGADKEKPEEEVKPEVIKEAWDESSSEDESEEKSAKPAAETQEKSAEPVKKQESVEEESEEESDEESEAESDEEDDDDDDDDEEEEEDHRTEAEKMKERARLRINKRLEEAEKKRTLDNLRAAVVCVLGHVDTGKTKILDKLRRTNVQDGEAGGITQQIGATNVPIENVKENTKFIKGYNDFTFKLPGLLIIDTPGHESFSNLRSRGSSLCDIAILVVDIMHGLEPQTIESLNMLKKRKTPFVVALNKIDRLYDWQTFNRKDVTDILKSQAQNTFLEFQKRTKEVILQFAEQGMNAALFHENPDPKSYISLVPTSAITGEGMGNLLFLIIQLCQNQLAKRLMFSEALQATVLEVKAIPGLGTTIDAILINGKLREGDTIVVAGSDGPIVTQIKALLMPQPMKELRVKNAYIEHKEITAAQGVKIAAKELEKAIAGINMQVAQKPDEVELCKEIVAHDLKSVLRSIKLSDHGVFVQASTLGSLEALLEFLKTSKIPYAGIRIGPVVKRDVMKASIMLEHEAQYATILAFDVKIERDAQDLADSLGVKIFQADIIYHLFDKFMAYRDELKQKKRDEFKSVAVFPCKLKILPQYVFNSRDPIVMGVIVEAGIVKEGTPICVPSKEFVDLGVVTSIENNHKNVESARKGQEVCIKIEPIPGEAPKMFGRHFEDTDMLVSKISRQSIDACKDYFRDDLLKSDWSLMVELKKLFEIL